MIGILTRNIGWKILSIGVAVLLWISVATEPEVATLRSVPVEYKGMPDNLEISSNFVESVFLEMRGPSGRLRDVGDAKPAVVLDFSPVHQPGERTFTIDQSSVNIPRGIQLIRAVPAQLRFRFEQRITRQVPVEVRFSAPHSSYEVAGYQVEPQQLSVVGPENSVDKTRFVVTDPIDISGVVSSAQFRVNTYLSEARVRFQSSSQVLVRVAVRKK